MNSLHHPHPAVASTTPDANASVTTLALMIRRRGISASLFSRYWRDVHGVLAARIPGFESYIQYHLDPPRNDVLPEEVNGSSRVRATAGLDGIAEVSFKNAGKRLGLATSDVTAMIQEDEQNVFGTSLLFNLAEGASATIIDKPVGPPSSIVFILLGSLPGYPCDSVSDALEALLLPALGLIDGLQKLRVHLLRSGEQLSWQTEGVDNQQNADTAFDAIVQLEFTGSAMGDILREAFAGVPPALYQVMPRIQVYPVRACHVMVDGGRPTELGLRGLDVQRTIAAVGAVNQRSDAVLRCIYGESAFGSA